MAGENCLKEQRMNLEIELHTIFAEKQTMKGEAIIFIAAHSRTDEKRGKRGKGGKGTVKNRA